MAWMPARPRWARGPEGPGLSGVTRGSRSLAHHGVPSRLPGLCRAAPQEVREGYGERRLSAVRPRLPPSREPAPHRRGLFLAAGPGGALGVGNYCLG